MTIGRSSIQLCVYTNQICSSTCGGALKSSLKKKANERTRENKTNNNNVEGATLVLDVELTFRLRNDV